MLGFGPRRPPPAPPFGEGFGQRSRADHAGRCDAGVEQGAGVALERVGVDRGGGVVVEVGVDVGAVLRPDDQVGLGDLPGGRLLQMRIGDNVVHGWDLATTLGRPADIDDALAEHVCAYLAPIADQLPATGCFAPPRRTLPPEASAQDRLLTMVGR